MKLIYFLLFLSSCGMDKINTTAIVKNESNKNIALMWGIDSVNDKTLFYGRTYPIVRDSSQTLISMKRNYRLINFFIFNNDTVQKYIKDNKIEGIVANSFLKRITISFDSLKVHNTVIYKDVYQPK
jgi:hypothetical protein